MAGKKSKKPARAGGERLALAELQKKTKTLLYSQQTKDEQQ